MPGRKDETAEQHLPERGTALPLLGHYPCPFIKLQLQLSRFSLLREESLLLRADGLRATSWGPFALLVPVPNWGGALLQSITGEDITGSW